MQLFGFLHVSLLLALWSSRSRQWALEMRTSATVEVAADSSVIPAVLAQVRTGDSTTRMPLEWTGVASTVADGLNDLAANSPQIGHFSWCGLCSKTLDIAS